MMGLSPAGRLLLQSRWSIAGGASMRFSSLLNHSGRPSPAGMQRLSLDHACTRLDSHLLMCVTNRLTGCACSLCVLPQEHVNYRDGRVWATSTYQRDVLDDLHAMACSARAFGECERARFCAARVVAARSAHVVHGHESCMLVRVCAVELAKSKDRSVLRMRKRTLADLGFRVIG